MIPNRLFQKKARFVGALLKAVGMNRHHVATMLLSQWPDWFIFRRDIQSDDPAVVCMTAVVFGFNSKRIYF